MTDPRDPSRRDFLATSALVLIGLARGSATPPDGDLLYVGTYTEGTRSEGIYLVRMDRRSGKLQRIGAVTPARTRPFSRSTRTAAFCTPSTSSTRAR